MKNIVKCFCTAVLVLLPVLFFIACPEASSEEKEEALTRLRIGNPAGGNASAVLAASGSSPETADAGRISIRVSPGEDLVVINPVISPENKGVIQYAVSAGAVPESFSNTVAQLANNDCLWIKISLNDKTMYYLINVTITDVPQGGFIEDTSDPFYGQVTGIPSLQFSMDAMPAPSAWNAAGDMYEYPNPFVRMNGTLITDPLDWEAYRDENGALHRRPLNNTIPEGWTLEPGGRRAEVKKIAEYYHQGLMPPPPDTIILTTDPGAAGGSTTITFTYNGVSASVSATLTMPDCAPNGKAPGPANKVPIFFGAGGFWGPPPAELLANGWATLGLVQGTDSSAGAVQTLFNPSGDDRPSNLMRIAWEASRWMDAAEMGAWGGCVDASKSAVSGVSRNGKAAMMVGAFAESQKGTRIALSIPASSGGGGANMERWTHQKQGLGRPAAGYSKFGLMYLNNYAMTPDSANIAVKIPPKDWNEKADKIARRTQIQNLPSIRNESDGGWVGLRVNQFTPQRSNFNLLGGSGGLLSTIPMDAHFIAALSAPNIWMGADGWNANALGDPPSGDSGWVSQEPVYMTYLAAREVYDFLGVEQNCAVILTMTAHAWPVNQIYAMIDYANWFFNKYHHPNAAADDQYRRLSGEASQPVHSTDVFTDRLIDNNGNPIPYCTWYNPMAREDYLRLNWKNPNRTRQFANEYKGDGVNTGRSIAANVRAYFRNNPGELVDLNGNPVSLDYPVSMVPEGN